MLTKTEDPLSKKLILRGVILLEIVFLTIFLPQAQKVLVKEDRTTQVLSSTLQSSINSPLAPQLAIRASTDKIININTKVITREVTSSFTPTPSAVPTIRKQVSVIVAEPTSVEKNIPVDSQNNEVIQPDVYSLFDQYGAHYGVDAQVLSEIAKCESGYNPKAVNGSYGGMFQFHPGTWASNRRAMGEDASDNLRFSAEESVKTAAFKISRDGIGAWPVCGRKAIASK